MATVASRVRKGTLTLKSAADAQPVIFSCDPTSIRLTPAAGDTGDTLEVLCGDTIAGDPGPTTWTMDITAIQKIETDSTNTNSLVLWALAHDGESAAFAFKPGATTQTFYGNVRVVAIGIGGDVGGTAPTSDVSWPMDAKPTTTAPAALAAAKA
jgi:hypothetical protein